VPEPTPAATVKQVSAIVQAAGDRIKTAGDILDYPDFFVPDAEQAYDDKAFDKRLRKAPEAVPLLQEFRQRLAAAEAFDAGALEKLLNDFVQGEGIQIGQVIHALRVAVTGKAIGFGLFETLAILGRGRCLARIDQTLRRAGAG
jgi:glutamyl-tRNA synthetase